MLKYIEENSRCNHIECDCCSKEDEELQDFEVWQLMWNLHNLWDRSTYICHECLSNPSVNLESLLRETSGVEVRLLQLNR